jgi:hypothetical protein
LASFDAVTPVSNRCIHSAPPSTARPHWEPHRLQIDATGVPASPPRNTRSRLRLQPPPKPVASFRKRACHARNGFVRRRSIGLEPKLASFAQPVSLPACGILVGPSTLDTRKGRRGTAALRRGFVLRRRARPELASFAAAAHRYPKSIHFSKSSPVGPSAARTFRADAA